MSKHATELAALRELALDGLAQATEGDLREQAREEGTDFEQLAQRIRSTMREAAASVLRNAHAHHRSTAAAATVEKARTKKRPTIERIKELVAQLSTRAPQLTVAFREGSSQSDSDWESLYDDLVTMGALEPNDGDSH